MKRSLTFLTTAFIAILLVSATEAEEVRVANMPPVVVSTVPQAGDTKVDPSITEIRVTFSKEMADGSWSWTQISDETFPPTTGKPYYLSDKRTCVLPVKLEPGRSYVTWLNSAKFGNFRDTGRRSAVPYLLVFETGKGRTSSAEQATARPGTPPPGPVLLSHVDNSAEGKRSLAGSGHAVVFDRPDGAKKVTAIQIFASRYGYPQAPDEDFHVYLLDEKQMPIKDLALPYALIARGPEKWYTFEVPGIEVPERFYVALSFDPTRTKGIYLGYDEVDGPSHSYTGLPDSGFSRHTSSPEEKVTHEWMVRVRMEP